MNTISVIGLGAGELEQLPLGVYRHLKQTDQLFVRTKDHPVLTELQEEGVTFQSFDSIYEQHDQFEDVYQSIVKKLINESSKGSITYAVPGHPFVAERTIQLLIEIAGNQDVHLEFLGGQSFLDPMYNALKIDPIEGCQIVDGTALRRDELELTQHIIIVQVYDAMIASDVKLTLMERLPDDYEVIIATAVGSTAQQLTRVPLYELDHATTLNNLTAVYVPPVKDETLLNGEFTRLREVIATLRGPNGCPWDKEQTHQSLKKYLIEETYEVLEAIDEEDDDHLIEELGDVLLQVMLHAQIGEDEGWFSIKDIVQSTSEKMIRRHPHVFGDKNVSNSVEVVDNWQQIKQAEKENQPTERESILNGIPNGLPALMIAEKLQKKAARVGFDWDEVGPMWDKLDEELKEFKEEVNNDHNENMQKELSDILFVIVNIARYYKLDSEEALRSTNRKFKSRFHYIEDRVSESGRSLTEHTLEELDAYWDEAKLNDK
ncbi:nucleoside triphosphate pyrophosphohydrolase [Alkalihalophilus lindianensis]|uniref:Nucleoside triphosphate pyrophosphohydrolase n=1 Tax=Alkalihalophilus lindianensis TaxID=1630542 RepID=A0ABU3XFU7_9BACI|nr:nucleoside triphosphate pyrophosphohydrolase [Alkalihalophilus lindianensis]MDV2686761.1 nucleoside triphosphate pyrophosphohydrolase [Alkalihalophilus lindianensis]